MSAAVNHELLTPLRCVVQVSESLIKKLKDPVLVKHARLIIDTTSLTISQVKCFLDQNVIQSNKFQPQYEKTKLSQAIMDPIQILVG